MNVTLIENFYNNTLFFSNEVKNEYIENVLQSGDFWKSFPKRWFIETYPIFYEWTLKEREVIFVLAGKYSHSRDYFISFTPV